MKVKGLDNREHNWNLTGHIPLGSDKRTRSQFHVRARQLLSRLYPLDMRLEEVALPGSSLFADFVLPGRSLMVEVHGEQHYGFVPHFHKSRVGYLRALARDQDKKEWCRLNEYRYCELPHFESDGEWQQRILRASR